MLSRQLALDSSMETQQARALYNLGMTGIPITNVNNNCATGSTALYQANNLVKGGLVDCALALGFERMSRGSLGTTWPDRPSPMQPFNAASEETENQLTAGTNFGPFAPRMFANGAQEYFENTEGNTLSILAEDWKRKDIHLGLQD
ncbi:hypothetical protein PHLCEN_2v1021 [Hermanssonia centrifuga]|uniref:Thiolase N-terminal domain-containing protein n=1 Tax=Hermanssonia centrifuga TaxID=98765 RepID=A0A2R6S4D7_9APHY|nr:hypothetical protein PHLCEN_2v1021 [Hermanssonia centrifuga]